MTTDHVFREAIAIAYEKPPKRNKYRDKLDAAARAVVQPDREIKHRDQKPVMRRLDASNNDEIGGEIGAKILAALRRKGVPTTPILRRPGRVGEDWGK